MSTKYKFASIIILVLSTIIFISFKKSTVQTITSKNTIGIFEPVAVVELFTSQGCSSCPSADRLLAQTIKNSNGKKIFALSFHVDYWNRLGWADPFSNAAFSKRQNDYVTALNINGAYTPQIVVNGSKEFVGSDKASLRTALKEALSTKTLTDFSKLSVVSTPDKKVKVSYALQGNFANSKINVALVSLTETTKIKRGENGGVTLINDNVVRQFITENANSNGEIVFSTTPLTTKENMAVVIYVQQKNGSKITGAAMASIE